MVMSFLEWKQAIKINKHKLVFSFFLLILGIAAFSASGDYATSVAGTVAAPDLILDHFGPYNLSFIFVWLYILVIAIYFIYPLIVKPKELPYIFNMFSIYLFIRSFFVIFTHLAVPHDATLTYFPSFLQLINYSSDLFFSGHAGLPFLAFLVFREHHKGIAYFMFVSSIILGVTVLLMHVHYSIDVLSAYFIVYGIYKIGNKFLREFKQDSSKK